MCSQKNCDYLLKQNKDAYLNENPIARNNKTGILDKFPILYINPVKSRETELYF